MVESTAPKPKPKRRSRKRKVGIAILVGFILWVAFVQALEHVPIVEEGFRIVVFDILDLRDRLHLRHGSVFIYLEDIYGYSPLGVEKIAEEGEQGLRLDFLNVGYEPNVNITRMYVETERDPIEIRATSKHAAIFVVEGKEYYQPGGIGRAEVYDGRFYMEWGECLMLRLELPPGMHDGLWKVGEQYHVIVLHSYGVSVYTLVSDAYPREELFIRRG